MSQSEIKAITEEVKNAKSMEEIYYIVKRCTGKEKIEIGVILIFLLLLS